MAYAAHVHPRYGIGPFVKFEPFFIEALKAFPATTVFKIDGLSPTTICARMRDSMLGYRLNKWTQASPEFVSLFDQHEGQFVFRLDKDMRVLFTPRRLTGAQSPTTVPFTQVQGDLPKYVKTVKVLQNLPTAEPKVLRITGVPDIKQIAMLAMMKAAGQIEDPIIFVGDIRSEATKEIENSSDIVFHFDEQRNETILL